MRSIVRGQPVPIRSAGRTLVIVAALSDGPVGRTAEDDRAFAAARYLRGKAADLPGLRALVTGRGDDLAATMRARRTQTNEPARCAVLLPALAQLPQPLALIEVGVSAGFGGVPGAVFIKQSWYDIIGTVTGA